MRRVRYGVGASLDGYIAGPAGDLSYLVSDPAYDARAFLGSIDTVLMGRRTYEVARRHGAGGFAGLRAYVFSRTLRPDDHPEVTVVARGAAGVVAALRREPGGKDIWLAGGADCSPPCSPRVWSTPWRWGSVRSCWAGRGCPCSRPRRRSPTRCASR